MAAALSIGNEMSPSRHDDKGNESRKSSNDDLIFEDTLI